MDHLPGTCSRSALHCRPLKWLNSLSEISTAHIWAYPRKSILLPTFYKISFPFLSISRNWDILWTDRSQVHVVTTDNALTIDQQLWSAMIISNLINTHPLFITPGLATCARAYSRDFWHAQPPLIMRAWDCSASDYFINSYPAVSLLGQMTSLISVFSALDPWVPNKLQVVHISWH